MTPTNVAEAHLQVERLQVDRQHIFVVDGAPDFLDLVRALFEEEHYNVTTTNFVPRTFDQIAVTKPDLLIVDLVLGQVAGWELLEQLHRGAATLNIPVILSATNPKLLDWARADVERYGDARTIVKPFDIDDIIQTVLDLIGPA
ncbi:MAG TPA: response regulator [Chloroflexota bacterium]|jgi:CheY-like chemotaxis protein|nr:response regulator [Chloroflexota bacterium]